MSTKESYALSKQIPDMARGFDISTNYGDITIEPHEAGPVIKAVENVMIARIAIAKSPDHFITVPEVTLDNGQVVPSFKVGKYTCSQVGDGIAVINPSLPPWVNITHGDAYKACVKSGWIMMTELMRLAIATDITRQPENWTSGKVGEGNLFQGYRKHSWIDDKPLPGNVEPDDPDERRWHVLSNGERIYDFAGNVWQWIFDDVNGDEDGVITSLKDDSISLTLPPFKSCEKGAGYRHEKAPDWNDMCPVSGGDWGSTTGAGVWALALAGVRASSVDYVGFRSALPLSAC